MTTRAAAGANYPPGLWLGGDLAAGPDDLAVRSGDEGGCGRKGGLPQPRPGRDVIRNFNADGFDSLYPKYRGGHPPKFTLGQRREIKKIAKAKPAGHDLPFSTWSLAKLADFLVAEGVVDDISHEGLRVLLREEGVTFQRIKTWKASKDPQYAAKKARIEQLYAIADHETVPADGDPEVIFCVDLCRHRDYADLLALRVCAEGNRL